MTQPIKAGARHSTKDQEHLNKAAEHLAHAGAQMPDVMANKAPGYTQTPAKGLADAPNLRGAGARCCAGCVFFRPVEGADWDDGYCTKYDFQAEPDFVCDTWEQVPPTPIAVALVDAPVVSDAPDGVDVTADSLPEEPMAMMSAKGDLQDFLAVALISAGAIKASGDWQLDVLAIPYGGPIKGGDSQGERFGPSTQLFEDNYPNPMVVYYHGYDENGRPQGAPENVGAITKRWTDTKGRWVRVALDKSNKFAKRIWEAAKAGKAVASSGSIAHLVRKMRDGLITHWPFAELSLFDAEGKRQPANAYAVALPVMKSHYQQIGRQLSEIPDPTPLEAQARGANSAASAKASGAAGNSTPHKDITNMDEKELEAKIAAGVAAAFKAQNEAAQAEEARKAAEQTRIDAAVKAALETEKANAAKARRLPISGKAPVQTQFADTAKYDNLDANDLAFAMNVLSSAQKGKVSGANGVGESAYKALAIKIAEDKDGKAAHEARQTMKAQGIEPSDFLDAAKSNELDHNTQVGYGDEWVGVVYSNNIWNVVRAPQSIVGQLPTIEVPQGAESITIPLEAADPTFYKVAATTDANATTGIPDATVTASKVATDNRSLTVAKGGARVGWNGELDEDSVLPFAAQLRQQLEIAAGEQIEHLVIDGDTQTSNANINSTAGSLTTNLFLLFDAFRKSPLVTTTANSRSAGGLLVDTDFLATAQLMGTAGLLGADRQKTAFIVDANTQWKASQLLSVKTKDVYSNPTLENGMLLGIWGYKVYTSFFMHFASAKRMAQTTGKIHATDSSNTTGSILAVRFDQWLLGYKRRITMEVTRYPRSDSSEITALFRIGLKQRDTEASAITYNVGV